MATRMIAGAGARSSRGGRRRGGVCADLFELTRTTKTILFPCFVENYLTFFILCCTFELRQYIYSSSLRIALAHASSAAWPFSVISRPCEVEGVKAKEGGEGHG